MKYRSGSVRAIVPTALLEMRDQYGVIKFQIPFAITIWIMHVLVMWGMVKIFG